MGGGKLGDPQSPKRQARSEEEKQRLPSSCPTESVLLPAHPAWGLKASGPGAAIAGPSNFQ